MSNDTNMLLSEAAKELNMKTKMLKQLLKDIEWLDKDGKTILPEAARFMVEGKKTIATGNTVTFPMFTLAGWFEVRKEIKRLEMLAASDEYICFKQAAQVV